MLNRRTPMKRTPFKRAAPAAESRQKQAPALASIAPVASKLVAHKRPGTYAAPTAPATAIPKAALVRSEALRRAVGCGAGLQV